MAKTKKYSSIFPLFFIISLFLPNLAQAQLMNHYWSQSYNSISTLLSGAVVGGDAGNAAIYYNPSGIVDLEEGNNISVAASIFTLSTYSFRGIMGDGKHISSTNLYVQPQFFSYGVKSPFRKWSFELAVFNRIRDNLTLGFVESQDFRLNPQENSIGRLSTVYDYENYYSDDWVGLGGGYKYSDNLYLGFSVNVSFSTFKYSNSINATVYPIVSDTISGKPNTSILAVNEYKESIDFTDIRIVAKMGATYKLDAWSVGLNVTLPALKLFSVGKKASRSVLEGYSHEFDIDSNLTDYYIFDSQKDKQLTTDFKLPFSIALGAVVKLQNNKKLYLTAEYFASLKSYKIVDAQLNSGITTDVIYDRLENKDWLTFMNEVRPVFNIAFGYQWQIKTNVLFLMGLRTDFNSLKNDIAYGYADVPGIYSTNINIYHATAGVKFTYKKHQLIAGTQFSFGRQANAPQIANFKSKDDFFTSGNELPLLGIPDNSANISQFSVSLFLGATLNFSGSDRK
ncbi:MAG: hypothetical protein GXO88_09030 [Chlorobi bacterium]|nr:hypothetical protein [Chlorobiota bacterium]